MKTLLRIAVFLLATVAMAGGKCPASPGDIQGQIDCGELECQALVYHAISSGQTCRPMPGVFCCQGDGPRVTRREGVEGPVIKVFYRAGGEFNGWPGRVLAYADGVFWRAGVFRHKEFKWDSGGVSKFKLYCPE